MISGLPWDLLKRRAKLSTHQICRLLLYPLFYIHGVILLFSTSSAPGVHSLSTTPPLHFNTSSFSTPFILLTFFSSSLYAEILLSVWVFLNISWKPNPAGLCLLGPALRSRLVFVSVLCCISRFDFLCRVKSDTAILLKFGWMQTRSIDLLDVSSLICTGAFEMKESIKWKKHCYLETIFKCCASEAY